jgi:hypothetical protein
MKIKSMKTFVLFALFFVVPFLVHAQELPPDDPIDVDTPIDSWLLVLIGAGALYGVFKMWNSNNQAFK